MQRPVGYEPPVRLGVQDLVFMVEDVGLRLEA